MSFLDMKTQIRSIRTAPKKPVEGTSIMKKMTSSFAIAAALSVAAGTAAWAQNTVTLQSQDDAVNLTGELVSFEDNVYVIRTNLGALRISGDRVSCSGEGCPQEPVVEVADPGFEPGQVILRSANGLTELEGKLVSIENEAYIIETGFGRLQIPLVEASCEGDACPVNRVDEKDVSIASSSELSGGLVSSLIAGFAEFKKLGLTDTDLGDNQKGLLLAGSDGEEVASVTLVAGSSTDAVQSLISGNADLAATTRSVGEAERAALLGADANAALQANSETVIALDAIAIAVSPGNPVRAIAEEDIARIFSGQITDWSQLGGAPGAINLYVRAAASGSGTVFDQLIMGPASASISETATVLNSDTDISEAVMNDPQGIGYTSFSTIEAAKPLAIRGECGIQTPANEFTIKTEEYPLSRRIYMYRPQNSIPQPATDFVDFVTSNSAQNIVKAAGFIGQDVTSVSVNQQGLRFVSSVLPADVDATIPQIQSMLTDLVAADRLSLTFRFEPGSSTLDTRAQADILRLSNMIKAGAFDNKEIIIAGFTDSIGVGDINLGLSQARAEQVRDSVLNAAGLAEGQGLTINAVGYGEMSPLGCNETFNGRAINRRVEIWAKDQITSVN